MDDEIKDIDTIENLKDLMALAQAADMKGRNDDVEQRLQQFYRKQKAKKAKARLWRITMAAAACLALILTLAIWKGTADDETLQKEQQPIVFNIAKPKANIMVRTEKGKKLQAMPSNNEELLVAEVLPEETERVVVDVPQGEKLTIALQIGRASCRERV